MAARRRPLTVAEMAKKGGKARWTGVSAEQRSRITRRAVRARWTRVRAAKKRRAPR